MVMAGVMFLLGCSVRGSRNDPKDGDPIAETGTPRPGVTYQGELKKEVEKYTVREWKDIEHVGWRGTHRHRDCDAFFFCLFDNTQVLVQAIGDAHQVKVTGSSFPPYGVVMGRFMNRGNWEEKRYQLPRKSEGKGYTYILIVPTADGLKLQLVDVYSNKPTDLVKPRPISQEPFEHCTPDPEQPHTEAGADFWGCSAHTAASPASGSPSPKVVAANFAIEAAWITCFEGCCSSRYPPLVK
jgi:hypothetical protein